MTLRPLAPALALLAVFPSPAVAAPAPDAACLLGRPGSDAAPAQACGACHVDHGPSHPVDLDYAEAVARSRGGLRAAAEVIRRGVLLPDGRLQCVTCHDGRSPFAAKIALPPGAPRMLAVDPRDRTTYEDGGRRGAAAPPNLPRGAPVSPAPLCSACHTTAD